MKGFIHVLEAILVSLILIVSTPFLISAGVKSDSWENSRLTYLGQDILSTMDRADLDSPKDGESELQDILEKSTPTIDEEIFDITKRSGIGYNMKSRGSLKNELRIGCNCTDAERRSLQRLLALSMVNDRPIVFRIFSFDYSSLSTLDFDIILINGQSQLTQMENFYTASQANEDLMREHLERGRGIVEVVDLTAGDMSNPLQSEIFGLTSGPSGSGDVTLTNTNDTSISSYYPAKYFHAVGVSLNYTENDNTNLKLRNLNHNTRANRNQGVIDNVSIDINRNSVFDTGETFDEGSSFNIDFGGGLILGYEVDSIDEDRDFVNLNFKKTPAYRMHAFATDPVSPMALSRPIAQGTSGYAAILNNTGKGKAAWISDSDSHDAIALAKSGMLWAAGEDWENIVRSVSTNQAGVSYIVSQGEEFFEPYIVQMEIWNLF